jgi:hypothetical protein
LWEEPVKKTLCAVTALLSVLLLTVPAHADVVLGQVQTFDDPDHHWVYGAGPVVGTPTPFDLALGGPGGAADPYLEIVAIGGVGPLSRLSAQNFDEWAGDYLAAGVNQITMDVKNAGPEDVYLRLLFLEFGAMGPVSAALTTDAVLIPAGSDWQSIDFGIRPSDLSVLLGTVEGALSNTGELRLFHNPDPFFIPEMNPSVAATLGVDNITATVPEPALLLLSSAGLAAVLARRRTSSRRPPSWPH